MIFSQYCVLCRVVCRRTLGVGRRRDVMRLAAGRRCVRCAILVQQKWDVACAVSSRVGI
ncbi:MAG: hypothetical protein ACNYPH_02770 [Gammaproteobacteria bacterium WSBS_2016_MAG_OTU1]